MYTNDHNGAHNFYKVDRMVIILFYFPLTSQSSVAKTKKTATNTNSKICINCSLSTIVYSSGRTLQVSYQPIQNNALKNPVGLNLRHNDFVSLSFDKFTHIYLYKYTLNCLFCQVFILTAYITDKIIDKEVFL